MHDLWPTLLYYLSVMAIVGATPSPPHPWRTGAVCEDANYSMPSSDLLRGKHLRVLELHWPPFAIRPNATKPNWTGYDIDLLHKVQEHLGFTFQVVDTQDRFPDETWEVYLERWMNHGDIMLSFWARSPERMRHWIQLNGHVDMATVLIARTYRGDAGADVLTWSAIFKCFHPFSWELWTCLLLMVVFSGFIDYVLEGWSDGGRIGTSLYEYAAGSLWGGFEYPRSRSSAIYQVRAPAIPWYTDGIASERPSSIPIPNPDLRWLHPSGHLLHLYGQPRGLHHQLRPFVDRLRRVHR